MVGYVFTVVVNRRTILRGLSWWEARRLAPLMGGTVGVR